MFLFRFACLFSPAFVGWKWVPAGVKNGIMNNIFCCCLFTIQISPSFFSSVNNFVFQVVCWRGLWGGYVMAWDGFELRLSSTHCVDRWRTSMTLLKRYTNVTSDLIRCANISHWLSYVIKVTVTLRNFISSYVTKVSATSRNFLLIRLRNESHVYVT